MVTSETIQELRRQTSVSSLDAMHALSVAQGDTSRAADYLRTARFATKALHVIGSELAARMAAALIQTGLWFECEQLDREKWHFAVAPAGYGRLVALHGALLCSQNTTDV
jgi:ABC-type transport system involved in Fe-S cluster assembly fused permease/ATPase subunit